MSFAQGSSCQRSVIGSSLDARGCVVSRTRIALYRLPDLTAQELPRLEGARVPSAVDQEVLTRHETGLGAADERAEVAELRGVAEAPGGVRPVAVADDLLNGPTTGLRLDGDRRAQAVRVERTGEQVVDRDVVADGLACELRDVDALAGERQGARLAESLRRRAHDRAAPPDSHVHGALLLRPRARTRRAPA